MISQSILNEKIEAHEAWVNDPTEGTQLILTNEIIEGLDFQEGNLERANFSFCKFKNCCFNSVSLEDASIKSCSFESCSMESMNFKTSSISQNIFIEDSLSKSQFKGAAIINCSFTRCYLDVCDLSSDEPSETESYQTTSLTNNKFFSSTLRGSQFNYSSFLLKNEFDDCNFNSSDFSNTSLAGINFSNSSFQCCSLKATDFSHSVFENTNFSGVNMDYENSIWAFCKGNGSNLITVNSTLFDFINITDERIFFNKIADTKENWFETLTDEEIVNALSAGTEASPEEIQKWWDIMKPVLMSICNYNIDN